MHSTSPRFKVYVHKRFQEWRLRQLGTNNWMMSTSWRPLCVMKKMQCQINFSEIFTQDDWRSVSGDLAQCHLRQVLWPESLVTLKTVQRLNDGRMKQNRWMSLKCQFRSIPVNQYEFEYFSLSKLIWLPRDHWGSSGFLRDPINMRKTLIYSNRITCISYKLWKEHFRGPLEQQWTYKKPKFHEI